MINSIKWVFGIHSKENLDVMQSWDSQRKIQVITTRIVEWYGYFGGNVYVAFSGDEDNMVLLDIVRRIYPDIPVVSCDTGLEPSRIREFIKQHNSIAILRPGMSFRKVIKTYGYPAVSKRIADTVEYGSKPGSYRRKELHGEIICSNGTPSEFDCKKWCYFLNAPLKVSSRCCDIMKEKPLKKYFKETGRIPITATMADES